MVQRERRQRRAQRGGGRRNPKPEHRLRGSLLPGSRPPRRQPLAVHGGARRHPPPHQRNGEQRDRDQLQPRNQRLPPAEGSPPLVRLKHALQQHRDRAAFQSAELLHISRNALHCSVYLVAG